MRERKERERREKGERYSLSYYLITLLLSHPSSCMPGRLDERRLSQISSQCSSSLPSECSWCHRAIIHVYMYMCRYICVYIHTVRMLGEKTGEGASKRRTCTVEQRCLLIAIRFEARLNRGSTRHGYRRYIVWNICPVSHTYIIYLICAISHVEASRSMNSI
jgi:hypothetical protein